MRWRNPPPPVPPRRRSARGSPSWPEGANIQVMQGHNYENKLSLNTDTLALLARCVFFAVPAERLRCEALLP
jgi:hypothetical protein